MSSYSKYFRTLIFEKLSGLRWMSGAYVKNNFYVYNIFLVQLCVE
jgi:hypothetical protein